MAFPFPPKTLQDTHSPCKNKETEAQKQKALGQQDPECREEAEVLPGTEQGIPLLPSAPHLLHWGGTGQTSQRWSRSMEREATMENGTGEKYLCRTPRMGWDSSSHKVG